MDNVCRVYIYVKHGIECDINTEYEDYNFMLLSILLIFIHMTDIHI